jgi:hypothetical protein
MVDPYTVMTPTTRTHWLYYYFFRWTYFWEGFFHWVSWDSSVDTIFLGRNYMIGLLGSLALVVTARMRVNVQSAGAETET